MAIKIGSLMIKLAVEHGLLTEGMAAEIERRLAGLGNGSC
jgi:hypothetical protein